MQDYRSVSYVRVIGNYHHIISTDAYPIYKDSRDLYKSYILSLGMIILSDFGIINSLIYII